MPCSYPGCVAEAPCPIYDTDAVALGKKCVRCRGTGNAIHKAGGIHITTDLCEQCGGTGLADARRSMRTPAAERVPVDQRGLIEESEK